MSAINELTGNGKRGNQWTLEQEKLAAGMKLAGAKRKEIAAATNHPENSVTYLFTRKLKFKTDIELFSYLGVDNKEELIAFAEQKLKEQVVA